MKELLGNRFGNDYRIGFYEKCLRIALENREGEKRKEIRISKADMLFTKFYFFVSYGPVRVKPVYPGKIINFRKVFVHSRSITICTGRPVIGNIFTFVKQAFYSVNIIQVSMKIIIRIFKKDITHDQEKAGNSQCQAYDVNGCENPVFEKVSNGGNKKIPYHAINPEKYDAKILDLEL
jgi:hypothetical protein